MRGLGRAGPIGRRFGRCLGFCRGNRWQISSNKGRGALLQNLESKLAENEKEKEVIVAKIKNLT